MQVAENPPWLLCAEKCFFGLKLTCTKLLPPQVDEKSRHAHLKTFPPDKESQIIQTHGWKNYTLTMQFYYHSAHTAFKNLFRSLYFSPVGSNEGLFNHSKVLKCPEIITRKILQFTKIFILQIYQNCSHHAPHINLFRHVWLNIHCVG